jgi:HK97 family phage major capsid protein
MPKIQVKVGSRHSKTDQTHMDTAVSHMIDAGANLPAPPPSAHDQRVADANAEAKPKAIYRGAKSVNLTELIDEIRDAWEDLFEPPTGMMPMSTEAMAPCIRTIYDDAIVICDDEGDLYRVAYTVDASGKYTFAAQAQWQEVEVSYVPANEPPEGSESNMMGKSLDTVVLYGGEIKSLGDGKVGGYGVRFTSEKDLDLTDDYFAPETYLGKKDGDGVDSYFHHAMPIAKGYEQLAEHTFAPVKATRKDLGIWVETVLDMADEYEKLVYGIAEKGKLKWSSGAPGHLVRREGHKITRWPIAEFSLTPAPAEPRNVVMPVKSLSVSHELKALLQAAGDAATDSTATASQSSSVGVNEMADEYKELIAATRENTEAVKAMHATMVAPPASGVKASAAGFGALQVSDVQKTAYKAMLIDPKTKQAIPGSGGFGDFLNDVRNADRKSNPIVSDRLRIMNEERYAALKASGSNETVPSEGGWLTQVDHENEFLRLIYDSGVLTSRCSKRSLGAGFNGTTVYGRDETSRVTGSRWGGVVGYHIGEGGTLTATKPQFRKIELRLKKIAVAVYATDELLQDTTMLEQEVMDSAPKEIAFLTDDDVFEGTGVAGPLGFMASGCLISVAKEAGQAAATILFANIVKMWSRRWAANSANYIWLINQEIEPQLFSMALSVGVGGVPVFLPPTGLSSSPYSSLFNRPVIPVEFCSALGTQGDIALVDLSQYKLIDKGGVQSASSIHVQFLTDETVFRFIYRVDGQPIWAKPLTPFKGSNTMSPFIVLDTRA